LVYTHALKSKREHNASKINYPENIRKNTYTSDIFPGALAENWSSTHRLKSDRNISQEGMPLYLSFFERV